MVSSFSSMPLSKLRSLAFFSLDAAIWTTSAPRWPARFPEPTRENADAFP
jgi:hypothetical protein